MDCLECGELVGTGARFCSVCGRAVPFTIVPPPPRAGLLPLSNMRGLYRPREGRMVAGVCAGFAQRYGWDATVVRLVLGLALFFGAGTPLLAYLIAWVVMPNGQYSLPARASAGDPIA